MVTGLFLLADYVYRGIDNSNQRPWIPGFGITGAIALTTGLHMSFTWPVIGSFNIVFGETGDRPCSRLGFIDNSNLWLLCWYSCDRSRYPVSLTLI